MKHKKILVIAAMSTIFLIIYTTFSGRFSLSTKKATEITVTIAKVIDGDTVELANGKKIRLLGIDTPEEGQYYYKESKNKLKQLIEGKNVVLEKDVSNTDKSGRLLRYLFVGNVFINLEMVRQGYANAYVVSPDVKYLNEFVKTEDEAREKGLGIWKISSLPYSDCIEIINFHYDAKGDDSKNLNDEYVTFRNDCDFFVDMTGWTVKDRGANVYNFPEFKLEDQASVTLFSGYGTGTKKELYWNSKFAIWNNNEDTLYLRDREGNLILTKSYVK